MDLATRVGAAIEEAEYIAQAALDAEGGSPWAARKADDSLGYVTGGRGHGGTVATGLSWEATRHVADNDPQTVLLRCGTDKHTLVRCQEALLASSPMLVHFAKMTLEEMAERYGVEAGVRR